MTARIHANPEKSSKQKTGLAKKDTFFFIPHTHWEGAVFKTREEYLAIGLPNILRALQLLKKYPNYRFVLDQACYVQPFLEQYPEAEAAFRAFVQEGRLAIVGGTDVMLDCNMPGGESFVRQVLYGKGYFRGKLGVEVTTGWQLDTFGHHAQMPQLLKLAGYRSFWFFRGVSAFDGSVPSEFLWEGLDGTRIPAFWLPHGYAVTYGSPNTPDGFAAFMKQKFDSLAPFARGSGRVGLAGADVCEPEEHVPQMVAEFNRRPDAPFHLRLAVPADFEAMAAERPELPVVTGELNPIFQGAYSSRIELKQRTRELERLLTAAEKFGVLLSSLGGEVDSAILWRAWEPMLFNQAHDLMSGVMTDRVYEDTIRGYDFARRIAEDELQARLRDLIARIDTRAKGFAPSNTCPDDGGRPSLLTGEALAPTDAAGSGGAKGFAPSNTRLDDGGRPSLLTGEASAKTVAAVEPGNGDGISLVVFNSLGWVRTDVATVTVGFSDPDVKDVKLIGPDGREAPCQILDAQRHADGALLNAKVVFLARDVPALGHAVYHLKPMTDVASASAAAPQPASALENAWYRVEVDLTTGAITGLIVKDGNWNALRGPGNVAAMETDNGDFWELYRPLDCGSRIAMTDRHEPPPPGKAVFSADQKAAPGTVSRGPVLSEFTVTHPFSLQGRFQTTIRLCAGLRRIAIRTRILNHNSGVRYRVLFPTSIQRGESTHEIPFGAILRPDGIEFPAQNWIDYGNGEKGIALLNCGLPGNNVADGTLMISLMRSTRIAAYGFGGGYEPGMSSDTGLELGKELAFDYALVPHAGDWRQAAVYRDGLEFNHPLIAHKASLHPGMLPGRWGFLSVSHPNIVVSSLKTSEDGKGVVLRIYEAAGASTRGVKIAFSTPVGAAEEVNLMEDPGRPLAVVDNTLQTDLRSFEIKTFKLGWRKA